MAETKTKDVDAMDLGDLMIVAIVHTTEPNRAHLLRAVILGKQAERRIATTLEAARQILPLTVGVAVIEARKKATRRATRIAEMRARRIGGWHG